MRLSRKGRDGGACDGGEELAVGTVAACLEAAYDAAEVFFHLLFDEDDAVEMVGHHLEGNDFDLGVVAGNAPPFVMDTLTEGREFHPWGIGGVKWRIASSHHLPKEGKATLCHHCHHVHLAHGVIVTFTSTLHRGFLLPCKSLLALMDFLLHVCKVTTFSLHDQHSFPVISHKCAKRQMPNKREGVVIIYYIVPIHLLLSLLIIIIYIRGRIFLISYLAFGILSHRPDRAPTNVITPRLAA